MLAGPLIRIKMPEPKAGSGPGRTPVVGVVRLELTASSSQSWRATNCATPR